MGASQIAILLLGIIPLDIPITDQVDVIEHNHYFDEQGKPIFDQLIFWDWNKYAHRFEIRDWRLIKQPSQLPIGKTAIWFDDNSLRKVTATSVVESWTQYDPELNERNTLPPEQRRGLWRRVTRDFYKEQ